MCFFLESERVGSGNRLDIGEGSNPFLTIRSDNDDGGITSRGNVGIGTTAPQEKLEVNGNVKFNTFSYKHFAFQGESSGGGNRDEIIYSAPNPPYAGIQGVGNMYAILEAAH